MTRRADLPRGAISYEQWLRNRIARPLIICGPPVLDFPSVWQDLFPFLKTPEVRELEHRARQAERQVREPEIGG